MHLSFSAGVASTGVLTSRGSFCGRCALRSARRASRVTRRPRAKFSPRASVSANGAVGKAARSNSASRTRGDGDASGTGETRAGVSAFSAADARGSLSALMREYARLAAAEPFILRRLCAALLCVVVGKFIGLTVPFLFKRAVDTLSMPSVSARAFAAVLTLHCAATLAASLARELRNGVFARAGQRVGRRITALSFAHILSMEAAFHSASHTGALTRVVDRGTRSVLTIFRGFLFSFMPTLFELVLVCAILFSNFSAWYVVVTLITFAVYLAYTFMLNNRMGKLRGVINAVENETSAKLTDSFFNVDAVTAFDNADFELERYDSSLRKSELLAIENEWLYVTLNFGQGAIFAAGLTTMLWMASRAIMAARMTVGSFVMLSSMLQQLWIPLNFLGWQYREVKQSLIDLQNLFQVLKRQPVIKDVEGANGLVVTGGEITFDGVSFTYPGELDSELEFIRKPTEFGSMLKPTSEENGSAAEERREALRDISFTVAPGKSLALVGPSGSGKSSTLRLLYRLYDVSEGKILIDGQDISKVTLSSLRQAVSIVPQDTVLFNETIAYNIRYGRPSATDEEVIAAAKAASIHDTIMQTAQGYETLVGERGVKLSGGERQRLSVARAFLKGSRIILEDESTSSLDSIMEMEVTKALKELGVDRTRVIVAHRLSTVQDADHIVVIQLGRKVEEGTHEELISKSDGVYREMWRRQQDKRFDEEVPVRESRMIYQESDERDSAFDDILHVPPYAGD